MSVTARKIDNLIAIGRLEAAESLLQSALRDEPDSLHLRITSAELDLAKDESKSALQTIRAVLTDSPDDPRARLINYRCLNDLQHYSEAEDIILSLISDYPEASVFLSLYADLCLRNLFLDKALRLSEEALRLDPEDETAKIVAALVRLVVIGDDKSEDLLKEVVSDNPDNLHAMGLIADRLIEKGKYREALQVSQALLRSAPDHTAIKESIIQLKALCNPIGMLYWPFYRWGWAASAIIWGAAAAGFIIADYAGFLSYVGPILGIYLVWVVSSWFVPKILEGWYRWRGV